MNIQDPVCGQNMDIGEVDAAVDHGGWTYFFCSDSCRAEFAASPDRYAQEIPPRLAVKRGNSTD
jgi:P-type Cu+ transporter